MLIDYIAALCGLIMVVGGIILLYKGIITLNQASSGKALTVEFKKEFRIYTQYPALGLFIIGIVFISLALYSSKTPTLTLSGRTTIDNNSIHKIIIRSDTEFQLSVDSQGNIQGSMFPNLDHFELVIEASGYEPNPFTKNIKINDFNLFGAYEIGSIQLRQVYQKPSSEHIEAIEGTIPSLAESGGFGAPIPRS